MAKAINWPAKFLNEVINENTTDIKIALRLGSIYYDYCYYVPDEVVDIRVDHKIIRKGIICGEMKLCKLNELSSEDFLKEKEGLKNLENIIKYLAETYDSDVNENTEVTVIYYRNLEQHETETRLDDPHM